MIKPMTELSSSLVGHRGYPKHYPENSFLGIKAALDRGAKAVEFDIQLTQDRVPVLSHDDNLERISDRTQSLFQLKLDELLSISTGEPARFGEHFSATRIFTLSDIVTLLANYPETKAFAEIKCESITHFGHELVVDEILAIIQPVATQANIISYDNNALSYAKTISDQSIGWILEKFDAATLETAKQLAPDFLVCNMEKVNDALWKGSWQWMLYETSDVETAKNWLAKGADYIETNTIGELLKA